MRNPNDIAAEVAARLEAERAEELGAAQEGARRLTALREALEALHDDFGATFDDGPSDEERSLWISLSGKLLAKWTRRGQRLVFQPELPRHSPREANSVEEAIAVTVEFLLRRRATARADLRRAG